MKLRETIIIEELDGHFFAVDSINYDDKKNYIIEINKTAKFALDLLKNEMSFDELVNAMITKYNISKDTAIFEATKIIDTLKKVDYLI